MTFLIWIHEGGPTSCHCGEGTSCEYPQKVSKFYILGLIYYYIIIIWYIIILYIIWYIFVFSKKVWWSSKWWATTFAGALRSSSAWGITYSLKECDRCSNFDDYVVVEYDGNVREDDNGFRCQGWGADSGHLVMMMMEMAITKVFYAPGVNCV